MTTLDTPTTDLAPGRVIRVLADRCAGCQECVIRCPVGALSMDDATWTVRGENDLCVGCHQCERVCPFSAISIEGPRSVAPRHDPPVRQPVHLRGDVSETRLGYDTWEEAIAEASRCLHCPDPTCVRGCPAHNDIPSFVAAVCERDLERAHAILARTTVIPDVCSRVCNQAAQCEGACSWSLAGGAPVAVGRLERFIADQWRVPGPRVGHTRTDRLSVGIVGSGPAAMGAAYDLVEAGVHVSVYERDARPGGLLVWGMPDFTLPDAVAARPWDDLVAAGVDLRLSTEVPVDALDQLLDTHDAVIMAHGASSPIRVAVPGVELSGVLTATDFLQRAKVALEPAGDPAAPLVEWGVAEGARVLVLGAGNTAMDVARLARRLGLEATCIDWLDERFALARPDELHEAREEGVEVRFSRTLTGLEGEGGRVVRASLALTTQTQRGETPVVSSTSVDTLEVDLVVMAMGYRVDAEMTALLPGVPVRKSRVGEPASRWRTSGILAQSASAECFNYPVGSLSLDREVGLWAAAVPRRPRVWVVGDALTGPGTVVEAMAQGRRAARAILDNPPRRSRGEALTSPSRTRVLVVYASSGGTTASLAQSVGERLEEFGLEIAVRSVASVSSLDLASCDAVVLGTWVEGLVVARVRPARAMREFLEHLTWLGGKPSAVFCTYGVNPREVLGEMSRRLEELGSPVIAQRAFATRGARRRTLDERVEDFATSLGSVITTVVHGAR